jgi:hypothetical protein
VRRRDVRLHPSRFGDADERLSIDSGYIFCAN